MSYYVDRGCHTKLWAGSSDGNTVFTPKAALPGAVATIYANISGAIYAAIVRRKAL
ncbi:Sodium/bile acid cotransporter 4 [Corynebacterium diphtheriae]|nr:Sodium/bile acid cotransporter 4 [Corynebacterium diphtheriae]